MGECMKGFISAKRIIIIWVIGCIFVVGLTLLLTTTQYRAYVSQYNKAISGIIHTIRESYPEVTDGEIMDILNAPGTAENAFFSKYGIDADKEAAVLEMEREHSRFLWTNVAVVTGMGVLLLGLLLFAYKRQQKMIRKMATYLQNINCGNYKFDMEDATEGEMAMLESEIYKTTIMLKESADHSLTEKQKLKDALSDISHQLKTPLTSLNINLDNLKDNPSMEEFTRTKLIAMAKRDTAKINQMVQQLLTLSKLDANAITFKKETVSLNEIVQEAMLNVEALCDLKGIPVRTRGMENPACIICDRDWEIQAVTNILKNGIEHAKSQVTVQLENYELYKEIIIENDGDPIGELQRRNIFNRFYSGENTASDSVGIGLSIANAVIRNDGGYITVESEETIPDSGVRFIIKYSS